MTMQTDVLVSQPLGSDNTFKAQNGDVIGRCRIKAIYGTSGVSAGAVVIYDGASTAGTCLMTVSTPKAADQGTYAAQYELGEMYFRGKGAPQDTMEAYKWVSLAAFIVSGDEWRKYLKSNAITPQMIEDARQLYTKVRNSLSTQLTAQQIAEAQRFVREWKPKQ